MRFEVEFDREDDGPWIAEIASLPAQWPRTIPKKAPGGQSRPSAEQLPGRPVPHKIKGLQERF